jgi:light-regulated signal transduction histidine kinase (bacteriophytochrome)
MENVQMYCELEDRVNERTKQLEESNRELQSFSSFVSHDLRAPLKGVYQSLDLLFNELDDELDKDTKEFTEEILESISNMQELVDGLLEFSRMGRKELLKEKVDVQQMVKNIVKSLKEQHKDRDIEFKVGVLPDVQADARLLKQVWVNLLSNAVKYTGKKEKALIEVSFVPDDAERVYKVKDNGAGFSMEHYNKLFSVFQRLHTQTEFEGTGIGLALVERIIHKHGGRIWATAAPEEGAEFSFSLPKN